MWPPVLDFSKDDCRRLLRRMELEAYSSIVSVFRAQGYLSTEKKRVMQELQSMLSISSERHRAEVRRAVNDERLTTVAHRFGSPTSSQDWLIEGRRLVPLLPRLVPQTAFTVVANQAASEAAEKNARLINPALTGNRELLNESGIVFCAASKLPSKDSRLSSIGSPTSLVVLPSGASIHIRGIPGSDHLKECGNRGHNGCFSLDGLVSLTTASTQTQTARLILSTTSSNLGCASPVKITISKSPQCRPTVGYLPGQPPKVILVSNQSSQLAGQQRSAGVPAFRTPTAAHATQNCAVHASVNMSGTSGLAHTHSASGGATVTTTTSNTTPIPSPVSQHSSTHSDSNFHSPCVNIAKDRPRFVSRQRFPYPSRSGIAVPVGSWQSAATHSMHNSHTIHVKAIPRMPFLQHARPESAGMRVAAQGMPGSGKIQPKPYHVSSSPCRPVIVVSAAPTMSAISKHSAVTVVQKSISVYSTGGKVRGPNVAGGHVITSKATNVVTVNTNKMFQFTTVKPVPAVVSSPHSGPNVTLAKIGVSSPEHIATGSKPNVIVVQKTPARRPFLAHTVTGGTTTVITSPAAFEKELADFIQESCRQVSVSAAPSTSFVSPVNTGQVPEYYMSTATANGDCEQVQGVQKVVQITADGNLSPSLSVIDDLMTVVETCPESTESIGDGRMEWLDYDGCVRGIVPEASPQSAAQPVIDVRSADGSRILHSHSVDVPSVEHYGQHYSVEEVVIIRNGWTPKEDQSVSMLTAGLSLSVSGIPSASAPTSDHFVHLKPEAAAEHFLASAGEFGNATIVEIPDCLSTRPSVQRTCSSRLDRAPLKVPQLTLSCGERGLDPKTGLFCSGTSAFPLPQMMVNTHDGSLLSSCEMHLSSVPLSLCQRSQNVGPVHATRHLSLIKPTMKQTNAATTLPTPALSLSSSRTLVEDLLSSSLAHAQINLDSYNFDEDDIDRDDNLFHRKIGSLSSVESKAILVDGCELTGNGLHERSSDEGELSGVDSGIKTVLLDTLVETFSRPFCSGDPGNLDLPPPAIVAASELSLVDVMLPQQNVIQVAMSKRHDSEYAYRTFIPIEEARNARTSYISIVKHGQSPAVESPCDTHLGQNRGHPTTTTCCPLPTLLSASGNRADIIHAVPRVRRTVVSAFAAHPASSPSPPSTSRSAVSSESHSVPVCSRTMTHSPPMSIEAEQLATDAGVVPSSPEDVQVPVSGVVSLPHCATLLTSTLTDRLPTNTVPMHCRQLQLARSSSSVCSSLCRWNPAISNTSVCSSLCRWNPAISNTSVSTYVSGEAKQCVNSVPDFVGSQRSSIAMYASGGLNSEEDCLMVVPSSAMAAASVIDLSLGSGMFSRSESKAELCALANADTTGSEASDNSLHVLDGDLVRQSKRKRKLSCVSEDAVRIFADGSWTRAASRILSRVSRFRGSNREKGELIAASWFLHPVDRKDAPDYYSIINCPMDFSTVRTKLDSGEYASFAEFHADMMLVRNNCFQYNLVSTRVYQDCSLVFSYYSQEMGRMLVVNKTSLQESPSKKLLSTDNVSDNT